MSATTGLNKLTDEQLFSQNVWGTYYLNRYYFSIYCRKTREDAGLSPTKNELTRTEQIELQWENYPAILHEFMHYLHEISTIIGQACLYNRILMKSTFTTYLKPGLASSESLGCNTTPTAKDELFRLAWLTNTYLDGDGVLEHKMHVIDKIEYENKILSFPKGHNSTFREVIFPLVTFSEKNILGDKQSSITIGRFYLYECIAYELDQRISEILNTPALEKTPKMERSIPLAE